MPASREGALEYYTYINTEQFKKDIREMIQGIDRVGGKTEQETRKMDEAFKKVSTAIAGYFSFQAAKGFVTQLVRIRGEFQQLNIALETMLGNKEKADALMEQIKELAATTPFQLTDVATGAKQLLAYGFAADTVIGTMKQLGDLAAGVSAPLGDIVYLYGTLKAQGRAYTQDIRQFTNRGIPILQELVKVLGVDSVAAVNKMVTAGKVGFPEVEKALGNMTSKGGQFFNLMEKQSKSLTGQISNLQDQFEFMLNDLGKSSQGFISGSIEAASELISHYKEILKTLGTIAAAYGVYRAALVATIAIERIQQAVSLEMAAAQGTLNAAQAAGIIVTGNLRKAWLFLTAAIEANPIGAVIAALTALYLGFEALMPKILTAKEAITELGTASEHFSDQMKRASDIDDLLSSYDKLAQEAKKGKDVQDELNETMLKINDIVPGVASQWDHLGNVIAINTSKVKEYSKSLRDMTIDQLEAVKSRTSTVLARYQEMIRPFQETLHSGQARRGINTPFGFIDLYQVDATADDITNATEKVNTLKPKIQQLKDKLKETRELISRLGYGIDTRTDEEKQQEGFESLLKDVSANFKKLVEVAGNKEDLTKIREGLQAKLDALGPSDAQKSELKDKILSVNKLLESYKVGQKAKPLEVPVEPDFDLDKLLEETNKAIVEVNSKIDDLKVGLSFDDSKVKETLEETKSYQQKLLDIQKKYDEKREIIHANFYGNPEETGNRLKILSDEQSREVADFNQTMIQKILNDPIDKGIKEAKEKIDEINGILSRGFFIGSGGQKIQLSENNKSGLNNVKDSLTEIIKKGEEAKNKANALRDAFQDVGYGASFIDDSLSSVVSSMGRLVDGAKDFKKAINDAKGGFSDEEGGMLAGIAGIAGGIGAAVGAVVNIVGSISASVKKKQEEADRRRADAIRNQNELLKRQLEITKNIYGLERITKQDDAIRAAEERRTKAAEQLYEKLKDINDVYPFTTPGGKEIEEGLRAAIDSGDWEKVIRLMDKANNYLNNWTGGEQRDALKDTVQEMTDIVNDASINMQEALTGISFDSLTSQLVDLFRQGEISAEDFANKFEEVIKNAILQGFSTKYVEKAMKPFYDMLAEFASPDSASGIGLSKEEIEKLKNAGVNISNALKDAWEPIQELEDEVFGKSDKDKTGQSGLAGAIQRSITEDTATELSGRINGMYLMTKKSSDTVSSLLSVQKAWQQKQMQQLSLSIRHLAGIESNTLKTANNSVYLSYLKSIDGKLSNGNDAKKAAGVK